jgi:general secretion pathway protein G
MQADSAIIADGTHMKLATVRKWEGLLSLLWACGGFFLLKLGWFRSGSTLLELLVVVGAWFGVAMLLAVSGIRSRFFPSVLTAFGTVLFFIGLLWITLIPRYGSPRQAPIAAAMTHIAIFRTGLDLFRADNGFYPTGSNSLQALLQQPAGATNWHGPYLSSIPTDPWGKDYLYECPGRHNSNSYDISSPGPPRQNAPIANWLSPGLEP